MTNAKIIHSYEDALYAVKRGFLIIGLTGYTGSGCSTVRDLLDSPYKPVMPFYDDLKKAGFENALEHRKLSRVLNKIKWDCFVLIEFSCVVFAFAMRKALFGSNCGKKTLLQSFVNWENPIKKSSRVSICLPMRRKITGTPSA